VCQRKPSIRNLRTFGCLVEAHLSRQERYVADKRREVPLGKKLVDRAMAGIYVACSADLLYQTPFVCSTGLVSSLTLELTKLSNAHFSVSSCPSDSPLT
jgi:hypothetical protein